MSCGNEYSANALVFEGSLFAQSPAGKLFFFLYGGVRQTHGLGIHRSCAAVRVAEGLICRNESRVYVEITNVFRAIIFNIKIAGISCST